MGRHRPAITFCIFGPMQTGDPQVLGFSVAFGPMQVRYLQVPFRPIQTGYFDVELFFLCLHVLAYTDRRPSSPWLMPIQARYLDVPVWPILTGYFDVTFLFFLASPWFLVTYRPDTLTPIKTRFLEATDRRPSRPDTLTPIQTRNLEVLFFGRDRPEAFKFLIVCGLMTFGSIQTRHLDTLLELPFSATGGGWRGSTQ